MEPNAPTPGGGPEAGPSLPSPESTPVQPEQGGVEVAPVPAAPEVDRAGGESANQNQTMVPVAVPQPIAPPAHKPVTTDDDQKSSQPIDTPELADDVDVIEKEWVDKAKEIVEQTKDDPHKQNHNVSVLKADYMKKRYGKDIKIPEDKPAKA